MVGCRNFRGGKENFGFFFFVGNFELVFSDVVFARTLRFEEQQQQNHETG